MKFLPRQCGLLSALLLVAPAFAQNTPAPERLLYQDAFLSVLSPDGVTEEQAAVAAQKVMGAWKFDMNLMQWVNRPQIEKPILLRLISDQRMEHEFAGMRGYASADTFTVRLSLIDDPSLVRTFAHELGHIQAFRATKGRWVPQYFIEGHGLEMNQLYSDYLHQDRSGPGAEQAHRMMAISSETARIILTDEAKSLREPEMEVMGLYFVEYVRVRKNISDAIPKMARLFESVGSGSSYEEAFEQIYHLNLNATVSEIVHYFEQTKTSPADRVAGTRYGDYLSAKPAR